MPCGTRAHPSPVALPSVLVAAALPAALAAVTSKTDPNGPLVPPEGGAEGAGRGPSEVPLTVPASPNTAATANVRRRSCLRSGEPCVAQRAPGPLCAEPGTPPHESQCASCGTERLPIT